MYKESGVRCRRNGTGNPPLCGPHLIAYEEMLRDRDASEARGAAGFGDSISQVFSELLERGRIRKATLRRAVNDAVASIGATYRPQPFPPFVPRPHVPPPPHQDPRQVEAMRAVARARQVLGFPHNQALTPEMVKDRKRDLAKKFHPDRMGGDTTKMSSVNHAADVLLGSLET